jgi:hypothetical protein
MTAAVILRFAQGDRRWDPALRLGLFYTLF